ncbi:hypothetical protein BJY24_004807 [Nocardia transvalensis]|uniref:NERD domain-containing protein n=1 Tax=Nocardia transvalensis TaxID=37333 RepID=A0A7W9PHA0_9NOCA|nr:hypothetical protein [Nocardia transvalensis]MBB5915895.1 hypothetical protein [Nocardia transvalensis]
MLVKVRNDDPSRLSSTERTVVNWLKSWTGSHALSGIAVVKAHGADLVVWTPKTCVVVVIKGFTERINGPLTVAETGPWTIDGHIAPLEGVQDGTEPMTEVRDRTAEIQQVLRAAPGREHVAVMGIVLVIPQLGTRVSLEKGAMPPGLDVVVGDGPSSLRAYFTQLTDGDADTGTPAGPDTWDAAQVGQALGALGFAAAATYSDLTAEGFPPPRGGRTAAPSSETRTERAAGAGAVAGAAGAMGAAAAAPIPAPAPVPPPGSGAPIPPPPGGPAPIPGAGGPPPAAPQRSAPRRTPAPPSYPRQSASAASGYGQRETSSAAPGYGPQPGQSAPTVPMYGVSRQGPGPGQGYQQRDFTSAPTPSYSSPAQPYSVPFEPRPAKPPRQRGRGIVPLVILGILVLLLLVIAMCSGGNDDDKPSSPPASRTTVSTTPTTSLPDRTIPSDTPAPACYPLQPDCPAAGGPPEGTPPAAPPEGNPPPGALPPAGAPPAGALPEGIPPPGAPVEANPPAGAPPAPNPPAGGPVAAGPPVGGPPAADAPQTAMEPKAAPQPAVEPEAPRQPAAEPQTPRQPAAEPQAPQLPAAEPEAAPSPAPEPEDTAAELAPAPETPEP